MNQTQDEDVPVFNEANEFTTIAGALHVYAKAVSRGVFPRLKFSQTPTLPPDFDPAAPIKWRVSVLMEVFDHPDTSKPDFTQEWEATGDDLFVAMVELTKSIQKDLEAKIEATTEALRTLLPENVAEVWSTDSEYDNNQDEIPDDGS